MWAFPPMFCTTVRTIKFRTHNDSTIGFLIKIDSMLSDLLNLSAKDAG